MPCESANAVHFTKQFYDKATIFVLTERMAHNAPPSNILSSFNRFVYHYHVIISSPEEITTLLTFFRAAYEMPLSLLQEAAHYEGLFPSQ